MDYPFGRKDLQYVPPKHFVGCTCPFCVVLRQMAAKKTFWQKIRGWFKVIW